MYEITERLDLADPVLVIALDGWVDAGFGMSGARTAMLDSGDPIVVARFDVDELIDYRARRPTMRLVDGLNSGIEPPAIEVTAVTDLDEKPLLLLHGSEPDYRWRRFASAVTDLALALDVRRAFTIGAYPAALPHTRPAALTPTATTPALVDSVRAVGGMIDVPAGACSAIELALHEAGIPGVGIWSQVPHYASAMPYPDASVLLLEGLHELADRRFSADALREAAQMTRDRLDELVAESADHQRMVAELEVHHDQAADTAAPDLPSGEELAAELQRFLREREG